MIKKITLTTLLVISMLFVFAVSKQKVAVDYLSKNQKELNISSQDIKDLIVLTDYYDEFSNVNRVWFQQTAYGLPLKSGMVAVHIINGKVINYTNSGVFDLKKQAPTPIAKISAKDAVARAASYVDITTFGKIELQQKDKNPNLYTFKPVEGWSNDEITAELLFVRDQQDKVKLGWEIQLHSLDENNFWIIDIDANDGSLINKFDHVIHCSFGFEKYLESHENTKEHHYRIIDDATAMPYGANNSTEEITANAS